MNFVPLLIIALFFVLFVPGYAWLAWSRPRPVDPLARLADAIGLSIALLVLLAEVFRWLGIRLGAVDIMLLSFALLCLWLAGWFWRSRKLDWHAAWRFWLGLLFFAGLILWRLYQARELALPAWVDSVHHTLIVRTIIEYGGVPPDLLPYIAVPFYYHYGFHLMAAWFAQWSNLPPPFAVLVFTQILNACVGLAIYRLAMAQWQSVPRAVLAAVLVGFTLQMPAYYLSWGRSTLLTGLILLLLAMAAALEVRRSLPGEGSWRERLRAALAGQREAPLRLATLTTGMCLTHYMAVLLFGMFLLVMLALEAGRILWRRRLGGVRWQPFAAALAGGLLALPWLLWVWQNVSRIFNLTFVSPLAEGQAQTGSDYFAYILQILGPAYNHYLMIGGGLGLLLGLFHRPARRLALWGLALIALALPWGLRISPFRPDHFAIVLFIPVGLFLAHLLTSVTELLAMLTRRWVGTAAQGLLVVAAAVLGIHQTADVINRVTVIAGWEDVLALQWIARHTPPDARFFTAPTGWSGITYRGVDGGYWITPYTGRWALVPPALYTTGTQEYAEEVNALLRRAIDLEDCSIEFWQLVRDADLDYLYITQGKGKLQPNRLYFCPRLEVVYQQGEVWIYHILGR